LQANRITRLWQKEKDFLLTYFQFSGGMGGLQNMMKQFQGASGQMGGPGAGPSKSRKK